MLSTVGNGKVGFGKVEMGFSHLDKSDWIGIALMIAGYHGVWKDPHRYLQQAYFYIAAERFRQA